ncbi:hypothetical protein K2173_021307 [Erythroxylum novogranatense]|uniref:RING-type E3 ubiquitin transferase n=1 Tax=Erythroxylum novogranatense TaxID=1862640 RepID=A0AAV8TWW1_9ROSI|nr:hypothetical protein K2173_021307 [Erythroxylum novogranatense]
MQIQLVVQVIYLTMSGQGNGSNNFPENIHLEDGFHGIDIQMEQHSIVPGEAQVHGWHPAVGLLETVSPEPQFWFHDLLNEDGPLSPPQVGAGIDATLENRHPSNLNLLNGQLINGPSNMPGTSSSASHHNIDLNVVFDGNYQDMESGFIMNQLPPGRPGSNQNEPPNGTANSVAISAGTAEYMLEKNNSGEDLSDSRRLSCKWTLPEPSGELLLGESSRSPQQAVAVQENSSEISDISSSMDRDQSASRPEQLGAGIMNGAEVAPLLHQASSSDNLGLGAGGDAVSGPNQSLSVAGEADDYHRSVRLGRASNGSELLPSNLPAWISRNASVQWPEQPSTLSSDHTMNTISSSGVVSPTTFINPQARVPNAASNLPSFQLNNITAPRTGISSTSVYTVRSGEAIPTAINIRNNPGYDMVVTDFQRGNLENEPMMFSSGSSSNIASSSPNGFSSQFYHHHPSASNQISQVRMPEEFMQRMSPTWNGPSSFVEEFQRRVWQSIANQGGSQVQSRHSPIHFNSSPAARELEPSGRAGNFLRSPPQTFRSGLSIMEERQTDNLTEVGQRFATPAQRRSRLASEVRNALATVRRGGTLLFEDVMVIDRSVLYGIPDEPDTYQDMRLDVDNMSYEELLHLQEQIGFVNAGLSETTILNHLSYQEYRSNSSLREEEPCCICQEQFADGENVSKLDCGHLFHFDCIKQWLVEKNACPICKMGALDV